MTTLTVRGLDDATKARLRRQAAEHGRSMEAEARAILRAALTGGQPVRGLGSRIASRFAGKDIEPIPAVPRTELPRAAEIPE